MAWRWILIAGIFLIFMFKLFLRTMNTSSLHPNLSCYVYVSLFCIFAAVLNGTQRTVDPDALAQWSFFGEGFVALDVQAQHIVLAETPGSKGVLPIISGSFLVPRFLFFIRNFSGNRRPRDILPENFEDNRTKSTWFKNPPIEYWAFLQINLIYPGLSFIINF